MDGKTVLELAARVSVNFANRNYESDLIEFAEMVAAREREECAKAAVSLTNPYAHCRTSAHAWDMAASEAAKAVRARAKQGEV